MSTLSQTPKGTVGGTVGETPIEELQRYISVAPQTKLAGLSYLILLIVMIMTTAKSQTGEDYMINIVVFSIVSVISLYTINCIVTGYCNIYAWFFAYLVFINAIIALLYVISSQLK